MVKKAILLASAFALFGSVANAQQQMQVCGSDQANNKVSELHPEVAQLKQALEAQIAYRLSGKNLNKFAKVTGLYDTTYDIPIVVHIIHNYGSEYISDEAVYQAIKEVNQAYNKTNDISGVIPTYAGNIPGTATSYIGNANIRWHLAQKDPQGRPTRGITRTRSYLATAGGDQSKLNQWAPDAYMNVWIIASFAAGRTGVAAYAYKPPQAAGVPYADGVIIAYDVNQNNINNDNTMAHELGHTLNLDHPFGQTNGDPSNPAPLPWYVNDCNGDDAVDDTPPTRGHQPQGCTTGALFDSTCTYTDNIYTAKSFLDTSHTTISDTSTTRGVSFDAITQFTLNTATIYPSAPIGTPFTIQLQHNGVPIASHNGVVTSTGYTSQVVALGWFIPIGSNYKLTFSANPGMYRDTIVGNYSKTINGVVKTHDDVTANFYNFFYNLSVRYGFFKIYDRDAMRGLGYAVSPTDTGATSLSYVINYPDTVNSQNIMDYTYCSKMFTNGQILRMRAALQSDIAGRNKLVSLNNLINTGVADASGNILPVADVAPIADYSLITNYNSIGGDILKSDKVYGCTNTPMFGFTDRSWQDTISSRQWTLSNGANTPSSSLPNLTGVSFSQPGWATVSLSVTSNAGSDSITRQAVYVADGDNQITVPGYYQEFQPSGDNDRYPIFNYFNNQFKWEFVNNAGYYDNYSIRYRTYDDRTGVQSQLGAPYGDYDDFFTPPFNLQPLSSGNCNLNFMYAGATRTANSSQMNDTLEVYMSTNCGSTWTLLKRFSKGDLATAGTIASEYVASAGYAGSDWKLASINIPTNSRVSKALFRFRYRPGVNNPNIDQIMQGTGNDFYIDRISISTFPTGVNNVEMENNGMVVAPNPTHEGAKVIIKGDYNTTANVVVTDITGKVVFRTQQQLGSGLTTIDIPAQNITVKGIYLVQVTTGEKKQTQKLVVY